MTCGASHDHDHEEVVEEFTPPCNLPEWAFILGIVLLSLLLIFLVICLIMSFRSSSKKRGKKG